MLFNSYDFIFLFFPIVLGIYFFLGRWEKHPWANVWLVLASLSFYGYWDKSYLPLLVGSILTNYALSWLILRARRNGALSQARGVFFLSLAFNLGLLGYYKYLDFLLKNLNRLGANFDLLSLVLPLGISFFTITQLLYLWDCYSGVTKEHGFVNYALFVSFFPHLLAGPILYHRQMMKQFNNPSLRRVDWENMSRGLTLFIIGLMKKVLIADTLSPYVGWGYSHTAELTLFSAWLVAISYMLQLYFDFSGYSDMAVGLARMMNLEIPINFNSPYRAANLINFWQRWHISLTNALTACIYMPMMRFLKTQTLTHVILAASLTMFLVGIWHGAGWTYVVFAFMNAGGIAVNYVWKAKHLPMPKILSHIVTLFYVLVTMVFFRAGSLPDAGRVLHAMLGANGVVWPQKIAHLGESLGLALPVGDVPGELPKAVFLLAILLVAFCPNSNQLTKKLRPSSRRVAILLAFAFWYAVLQLASVTEFLYFQF